MRSPVAFVLLPLLAALGLGHSPASAAESAPEEVGRIRGEVDALEHLVTLASSSTFYLVLDPSAPRLTLRLRGVILRDYDIASVETARQRVGFFPRGAVPELETQTWSGGELDPPRSVERVVFTAPAPDPTREEGSVEVPLPPPVEEAVPVPARYGLRFAEGPLVLFRATGQPQGRWRAWMAGLAARYADFSAALRGSDPFRIRVSLSPEDHASLYRALPPGVSLLIHAEDAPSDARADAKGSAVVSASESRRGG